MPDYAHKDEIVQKTFQRAHLPTSLDTPMQSRFATLASTLGSTTYNYNRERQRMNAAREPRDSLVRPDFFIRTIHLQLNDFLDHYLS